MSVEILGAKVRRARNTKFTNIKKKNEIDEPQKQWVVSITKPRRKENVPSR